MFLDYVVFVERINECFSHSEVLADVLQLTCCRSLPQILNTVKNTLKKSLSYMCNEPYSIALWTGLSVNNYGYTQVRLFTFLRIDWEQMILKPNINFLSKVKTWSRWNRNKWGKRRRDWLRSNPRFPLKSVWPSGSYLFTRTPVFSFVNAKIIITALWKCHSGYRPIRNDVRPVEPDASQLYVVLEPTSWMSALVVGIKYK